MSEDIYVGPRRQLIKPICGEDYEKLYGVVNWDGKVVLDVGGSNGDSSSFFLSKGAIVCINIDCNINHINECRRYVHQFRLPIISICDNLSSPQQWQTYIDMFRPDVVKVDCEGCEDSLMDIAIEVFRLVPEYLIEAHGECIDKVIRRLPEYGYEIRDINAWAGKQATIIYAVRKTDGLHYFSRWTPEMRGERK